MSLVVECSNCQRRYALPEQMAGKKVKCKQCGTVFAAVAHDGPASAFAPAAGTPRRAAGESANPFDDPSDDSLAAMASLEAAGTPAAPRSASGRSPALGGSMYAGASASAASPVGNRGPVDPLSLAQPVVISLNRSRPIRRSTAVGLDAATPFLLLGLVAGLVAMAVMAQRQQVPEDMHPLLAKHTKTAIWITQGVIAACFFAVVAPLCWLAVVVASKVMRFEMPAGGYVRAAGVAAVPLLASLAIDRFLPADPTLRLVVTLGVLPLAFLVLKYTHELLLGEAAVAFGLGAGAFYGGLVVTGMITVAVLASGVIPSEKSVRLAVEEDQKKKAAEAGTSVAAAGGGGPNAGADGAGGEGADGASESSDPSDRAASLKNRLAKLNRRNPDGASRESLLQALQAARTEMDAARPQLQAQPDWAEIEQLVAAVQQKAEGLPSDAPDPGIFDPMPAGTVFPPPAPGAVALGEEVTLAGRHNVRPPADARLDLRNSGDAQIAWTYGGGPAAGSYKLFRVPRKNARQQRPWLVTQPFMKHAAEREGLYYVDATSNGSGDGSEDDGDAAEGAAAVPAAGAGGAVMEYGTLNGVRVARAASSPGGATAGGERWVQYVALDGNDWVVFDLRSRAGDAAAFDAFDMAARTLRPLRPGEPKLDPFTPDRVADRLGEDPEAVSAILRKHPAAAEPIVVRLLASPDLPTRRAAANLLQSVGTEKVLPQVQPHASSPDPEVAGLVRAFLKRLRPAEFDAVAEAMMDLKGADLLKRRDALQRLAALPADPKRRNAVAAMIEPSLMDPNRAFHEGEAASMALEVWAGDQTATRLVAALNNEELSKPHAVQQRDFLITALGGTKNRAAAAVVAKWAGAAPEKVTAALTKMGPTAEEATIQMLNVSLVAKTNLELAATARGALVNVLAEIGTNRSLEVLGRVSRDKRDVVIQETARQAMESVKARAASAKPAAPNPAAPNPAAPKPGTAVPPTGTRPASRAP